MKYRFIVILIILLLIFNYSVNANKLEESKEQNISKNTNKTLYVGGSGQENYTSVQAAVNASNNGSTIFVYSGIYYENIIIDKSINLIGENRDTTIIDGNCFGDVITVSANWVNVNRFTIKNCGKKFMEDSVVKILSSNNNFSYNLILCNTTCLGTARNPIAFYPSISSDRNTFFKNYISNSDMGFYVLSSYNNIVSNTLTDFGSCGIWLEGGVKNLNNLCNGNNITNNIFFEEETNKGAGYGMILQESSDNKIIGNSVRNKYCGIHLESLSDNNIVSRNDFSYNRGYGVGLASASYCNVSYNNVTNNQGFGIGLQYSPNHDNVIYHNNLINNGLNSYARNCRDIDWVENYYDDWIGLRFQRLSFLPYKIPCLTLLNGRIKTLRISSSNFDWNPAKQPYVI